MAVTLRLLPDRLAICRLEPDSPVPDWCLGGGFRTVSWTAEETSVVCPESGVPAEVRAERGWRAFMVEGPLDFSQTGVLAEIAEPLARADISIFVVSTFDTDFVLVREASVDEAQRVLAREATGAALRDSH
ncbi:MAG: ACT domain-containing protein [Actinobacteria bacterium]|nr:ACT domain-containing protein [Actinomycetota bacterium]